MPNSRVKNFLVTALAASLGAASFATTASNVVTEDQPELAMTLWPANGTASARLADHYYSQSLAFEQIEGPSDKTRELVQNALALSYRSMRWQPINPRVIRTIARGSEFDEKRSVTLLGFAAKQSRRDGLTQLWMAENLARAGDSRGALNYLDALLRRRTPFRDSAGHGLANALASPDLVPEIARMLRRSPPWNGLLYYYLLHEKNNWNGFLALHRELQGQDIIPLAVSAEFSGRLLADGRITDAVELSELIGRDAILKTSAIEDTNFETDLPLAGNWLVADSASATLTPLAEGGALISVSGGTIGVIAKRVISLEPGSYRATLAFEPDESAAEARPVAKLSCVRSSPIASELRTETLQVGSDCSFQWLSIEAPEGTSTVLGDTQVLAAQVRQDG